MMEHISLNSMSHDNSTPEHWPMENRQTHFGSWEGNITDREIPADTKGAEAKNHDDLLTRNKSSRRDFDSVRPAASPVFNEKNCAEAPSMQRTHVPCVSIDGSRIPAKVTSVTGLIVGDIMLDDVPLASVNQEWAVPSKEVHDTASSLSRPWQVKKSEKNQHGLLPVETPVSNDSVMCKPIKQTGRKEEHAEGGPNGMIVAAAIQSSGNHSMLLENVATTKKFEMHRYAHKPVYEELQQQNLGPILPGENRTSYDNRANSNLETKALANFTKEEVRTELKEWPDRKTTLDHQGRSCGSSKQKSIDELASVVQNLAKPAEYFNVADVIQESSDQWQQGDVQFESKAYGGTEDRSKLTEMVSLPDNTWEKHPATDSPRRYHVEAQRNVGSRYGYRERAGRGRFFLESSAPSRACWMPKYTSGPQSDAQDDGVSEWLHGSHQVLLDMDNSQGLHSKPTQIADRDAGMDLQGGEGNVGMSFGD